MLYCNLFEDGEALLERDPQGSDPIPVSLSEADERAVAGLLFCAETSAAPAKRFLAGVSSGR